jgi:predicted Zn-dependent protease
MSRVALLQEATGEDSAALNRAERAIALDSTNSEAAMVVARMRILAGQPRFAVRALTPPLRQPGAMPELFALRALAHHMARNYSAALGDLERTGPLLPDFQWMAAGILAMALEDGRLHEAHAAFELAIKLRPDDPRTIALGMSLARRTGNLAMERALESALRASALP